MREAIGSYFLTGIVVTFVVLFTGYLCLSINMNKAYKVKNEIINIIQKNNGLDGDVIHQITDYMNHVGYRTNGECETKDGDGYQISGAPTSTSNAVMCVKQMAVEYTTSNDTKEQFPPAKYYQIKVFFGIDLPIVRKMFTFSIKGSTKKIFNPIEDMNNKRR